jgi:hypothetical protein
MSSFVELASAEVPRVLSVIVGKQKEQLDFSSCSLKT